jgi:hypothetical protein
VSSNGKRVEGIPGILHSSSQEEIDPPVLQASSSQAEAGASQDDIVEDPGSYAESMRYHPSFGLKETLGAGLHSVVYGATHQECVTGMSTMIARLHALKMDGQGKHRLTVSHQVQQPDKDVT